MKVEIELTDLVELVNSNNRPNIQQVSFSNAHKIEKKVYREITEENKTIKMKLIHHGGCLSCIQPQLYGLGYCLECQYCSGNGWDKPDLSTKKINYYE